VRALNEGSGACHHVNLSSITVDPVATSGEGVAYMDCVYPRLRGAVFGISFRIRGSGTVEGVWWSVWCEVCGV